jgi:ParB/Sulfiredoxin domain
VSADLSPNQFDMVDRWDSRITHQAREPEGHMPLAEVRKHVDPVFHPWSKFHAQEDRYIGGLAESMSARGVHDPLIIDTDRGLLVDGHHRLAAAERLGLESLPWRRPDR